MDLVEASQGPRKPERLGVFEGTGSGEDLAASVTLRLLALRRERLINGSAARAASGVLCGNGGS